MPFATLSWEAGRQFSGCFAVAWSGRVEDKLAPRDAPSCPLFFDDTFVPIEARLGPESGEQLKIAMECLETRRPINRYVRGAKLVQIVEGGNPIRRMTIADSVVDWIKHPEYRKQHPAVRQQHQNRSEFGS